MHLVVKEAEMRTSNTFLSQKGKNFDVSVVQKNLAHSLFGTLMLMLTQKKRQENLHSNDNLVGKVAEKSDFV